MSTKRAIIITEKIVKSKYYWKMYLKFEQKEKHWLFGFRNTAFMEVDGSLDWSFKSIIWFFSEFNKKIGTSIEKT